MPTKLTLTWYVMPGVKLCKVTLVPLVERGPLVSGLELITYNLSSGFPVQVKMNEELVTPEKVQNSVREKLSVFHVNLITFDFTEIYLKALATITVVTVKSFLISYY